MNSSRSRSRPADERTGALGFPASRRRVLRIDWSLRGFGFFLRFLFLVGSSGAFEGSASGFFLSLVFSAEVLDEFPCAGGVEFFAVFSQVVFSAEGSTACSVASSATSWFLGCLLLGISSLFGDGKNVFAVLLASSWSLCASLSCSLTRDKIVVDCINMAFICGVYEVGCAASSPCLRQGCRAVFSSPVLAKSGRLTRAFFWILQHPQALNRRTCSIAHDPLCRPNYRFEDWNHEAVARVMKFIHVLPAGIYPGERGCNGGASAAAFSSATCFGRRGR